MRFQSSLAQPVAVIFFILACLNPTRASGADGCDLAGKFRNSVLSTLGSTLAESESSFKLEIVQRSSGEVLCQDSEQPDQNIYPASTIKTAIAFAILRKVDAGLLKFDDVIAINQPNAAVECQDWNCAIYGPGKTLTLQQLLWDMITVSNNLAANQLMDVATKTFINQTADLMNAHSVQVYRKVYNIQDPEPNNKLHNTATAAGFVEIFREISTGRLKLLTESSREHLVNLLKNQYWHDSLNAKWPTSPVFYHKTGDTSQATADSGFFYVGKNDEYVAILVGLQGFAQFKTCASCAETTGYTSLSEIGFSALQLAENLGL